MLARLWISPKARRGRYALKGAKALDLGDGIVSHGSVDELLKLKGLDAENIAEAAQSFFETSDDEISGEVTL